MGLSFDAAYPPTEGREQLSRQVSAHSRASAQIPLGDPALDFSNPHEVTEMATHFAVEISFDLGRSVGWNSPQDALLTLDEHLPALCLVADGFEDLFVATCRRGTGLICW